MGMPAQKTLPDFHTFSPKMDGWNTIVSFWGPAYFQGQTVSFREGISLELLYRWDLDLEGLGFSDSGPLG